MGIPMVQVQNVPNSTSDTIKRLMGKVNPIWFAGRKERPRKEVQV